MHEINAIGSGIGLATIIMWVYLARIYGEVCKIRKAMELNQRAEK